MLRSLKVVRGPRSFTRAFLTPSSTPLLHYSVENTARIAALDRPEKLNSLTTSMTESLTERLLEYRLSEVSSSVILKLTSPRAFCAGGDVAAAAKAAASGEVEPALDFFFSEYSLNYLLSVYPKPVVSYLDGITMGGGVGLSVHLPFRVATERTRIAMPEMDIGYFPDVGTTFFLPRLDGGLGKFLALTGSDLRGVDTLIGGFATHYVPSNRLPELTKRISGLHVPASVSADILSISEEMGEFFGVINSAIEEFTDPIPQKHEFKYSNEEREIIDEVFTKDLVSDIFDKLANTPGEFAAGVLENLKKKLPISLKLANELLEAGKNRNIRDCLLQELIVAENMLILPSENDFVEGVTKKLITKTNDPQWKYNNINEVPSTVITKLILNRDGLKYADLKEFNLEEYPATYKEYPYNMGLPKEQEVKDYVTGNDGSNRDYAPTRQEVLTRFARKYHNKVGVNWMVNNILDRKTEKHSFDEKYLSWK